MGVCDLPLMNQVCDAVGGVASGVGSSITDGIGAWIAKSMSELATSAANLAAKAVDSTTAVNLNASWFRDNYELLLPIGLILTVGTFCLALMRAAWRRDGDSLAQAVTGTITGVFFAFAVIGCTTAALTVVDALSAGLFHAANTTLADAVRRIVDVSELGSLFPLGWAVPSLIALGCAIGAFLYWGVMVFRKVAILILVTLAIFAGAGGGWEFARRWRRGWIEATATMVFSKLLMTIVFVVGISAIGRSDSHDGLSALSDMMAGIVVMVLVLLCPFAAYRFVHWASDGGNGDELHRTSAAGLATAAGAAKTAGSLALQAGTGMRAPQGPNQVPGMGADGVASGIDPTGGSPAPQQTRFRFGEDPNAPGDRGRPLIQRPRADGDKGQALIRRPGQGSASTPFSGTGGGDAQPGASDGAYGSAGSDDSVAPLADQGPPPQGAAVAPQAPHRIYPGPDSASSGGPASAPPPAAGGAGAASSVSGPSPQGSPTPHRWVFPNQPPGSGSSS
ncbi:SCO6881 family protein [Streptomyces silvisoli]|uniref:ATP-binding protein n=1 Tax=Streptomyces silvisoli TaxID=3034235 RepID=A0ABT5ZQ78_9ACTN|nr:ATP-binding protein [Streptomyces silvisoli]MDF3291881.1 ATP-binding protein [Streptomyces silvisoli]